MPYFRELSHICYMRIRLHERFNQLPLYILLMGIALLPLVFSRSTLDPVLAPRFTFLGILCSLIAMAFYTNKKTVYSSQALWPFLIYFLLEALGLLVAVNPLEGLWTLARDAEMLLLLVLLLQVFSQTDGALTSFCRAFVIANGIIGLFGLFQLIDVGALTNPELLYEVKSTMAHRNLFASGLVITLPFLVYTGWSSRGWWQWVSLVFIAHSSFLILILESRTAWLAFLVFIGSYFVWIVLEKLCARWSMRIWKRLLTAFVIISISMFAVLLAKNEGGGKGEGIRSDVGFSEVNDKTFTIDERVMLWKGTLRIVWNESFLGVGPNNWKIVFPAYGSDIWRARQGMVQFQRPHNDFLWVLSEVGILGLLAYFSCFLVVLFLGLRTSAQVETETSTKVFIRLVLSGLAAYLVVACFSFPRERIFHQVVLFSLFAVALHLIPERIIKGKIWTRAHYLWMAILALVCIFMGYSWWKGEIAARKMNHARAVGNWEEILQIQDGSKEQWLYQMDATSIPLSFYSGLAYLNLKNYSASEAEFSKAYIQHPNNIHVVNNMANILYLQGEVDSALVYYKRALDISPKYLDGALNLMAAYFNTRRVEEAYGVLSKYEEVFRFEMPEHAALDRYRQVVLEEMQSQIADEVGDSAVSHAIKSLPYTRLEELHFNAIQDSLKLKAVLVQNIH